MKVCRPMLSTRVPKTGRTLETGSKMGSTGSHSHIYELSNGYQTTQWIGTLFHIKDITNEIEENGQEPIFRLSLFHNFINGYHELEVFFQLELWSYPQTSRSSSMTLYNSPRLLSSVMWNMKRKRQTMEY